MGLSQYNVSVKFGCIKKNGGWGKGLEKNPCIYK